MRKTLKTLACIAVAALAGSGAFANYGWYDTSIDIGGITSDFSTWSQGHGAEDTDLGVLTSLTISGVRMKVWDDSNDRGGANMFFRLYGENGQIGTDKDLWLGVATRITGDHDFSIDYTGTYDLADELGVELEEGKTYYLTMWAKTYGDAGDHYYSGEYSDNFHTKFIYSQHQTVTFDPSPYGTFRGEPTMEMVFEIGGTYHDLPNTTPDGTHARIGWYTMPDGEGGDPVVDGDDVTDAPTRTLYAHWTDEQTLTFDPQNGEDPWTEVFTVGQTYGTLPKPTWEGHAFVGWFTEAGKKLSNTSKVTTRAERTIYAQWSTEQTVVFDAQGGDCDPATMTAEMGGRYGPLPKPTKAGYAFVGWYTKAEGGSHLTANSIVTTLKTRTFYAHWTNGQTVTFVANGGSCDTTTMEATIGETYGELPKATQSGYIFKGWYTKAEGGSKVTAAATVTSAKTRTLYAHWKEKGTAPAITGFSMSFRSAKAARDASANYELIDSVDDLEDGTYIILTGSNVDQAMKASSGGYFTEVEVSPVNGVITTSEGSIVWKVVKNSSEQIALFNETEEKYAGWSSGNSATLQTTAYYHTITLDASGFFQVRSVATPARYLQNNHGSTRFAYYQNTQKNLRIYAKASATEPTVTLTLDPDVTKIAVGGEILITGEAEGFDDNDAVTWSWTGDGEADGEYFLFSSTAAGERTVTATATLGSQTASKSVTIDVCTPHAINVTSGAHGFALADADTAIEGTTVNVEWDADDGYTLDAITVNGTAIEGTSFEMPDAVANVNVTFKEKPAGFEKITSLDQLTDGEYVITGVKAAGEEYAMKAEVSTTSTKYILRRTEAVTIEDGAVTDATDDIIWTLAKDADSGNWTIYNSEVGYVFWSSGNSANAQSTTSDNSYWSIELNSDGDGTFAVKNAATPARNLRYNTNSGQERFAAYQASSSGLTGSGLNLYKAPSAPQTQTVTFDPSPYGTFRGEPTMTMTFEFGGTYHDLPGTTPDGTHARIGWYRVPDGEDGEPVLEGDAVSGDATVTFYAHWTDKQTLTFDPQNGDDAWTGVFTVGSTYGTLPKPTWAGHAFVGWFTEAGKKLSNTSKVTTRPERTIYAQWSTEQTVVFDAQGGDCDPATMTAEMGGRYGPLPKPTKAGYAFVGWYTKAEGGSHLTASSIVTTLKSRTFYAHWTAEQTVTFVANGGSCDTTTMVATIGATYGEMPKATQSGYIFKGWYTKAEGGSKVTAAATVTAAKSRTLYAHWKEKGAAPSITAFSVSPRAPALAARAAGAGILECTLVVETSADLVYEVQWTTSLLGEWTVLKHWTAADDGEFPVTVEVPADSSTGFLRIVEFDED